MNFTCKLLCFSRTSESQSVSLQSNILNKAICISWLWDLERKVNEYEIGNHELSFVALLLRSSSGIFPKISWLYFSITIFLTLQQQTIVRALVSPTHCLWHMVAMLCKRSQSRHNCSPLWSRPKKEHQEILYKLPCHRMCAHSLLDVFTRHSPFFYVLWTWKT